MKKTKRAKIKPRLMWAVVEDETGDIDYMERRRHPIRIRQRAKFLTERCGPHSVRRVLVTEPPKKRKAPKRKESR